MNEDDHKKPTGLEFLKQTSLKWQEQWQKHRAFEPDVNEKQDKFFLTFPYPYINAQPHIGHLYTLIRVDAFARYMRSKGYNVLFPQGWHVTGSPIISAAKRVKEREEKQLKIMRDMGIPDEELPNFEDPEYWVSYFKPRFKDAWQKMGASTDWRREFITTSLNPHYDRFIRWQFNKLREGGYVIQGSFPVVWDPKENVPVGDHDRTEGEGEAPQEFCLLRFSTEYGMLVAATLRPETMWGQTNLWVNPDIEYVRARVGEETWIMSEECAHKLTDQNYAVEIQDRISGSTLLGLYARAPVVERDLPVLPASFPRADKGTGIVTSVPSDAPDDYVGLIELQQDSEKLSKHGLSQELVQDIEPIGIIHSEELGDMAAKTVVDRMGIQTTHEREKLEEAKKEVYKKGYYEGVMRVGPHAGEPVERAKTAIWNEFLEQGTAERFYELTGQVISRNLVECTVKIVSDQWFLNYADPQWKKQVHKCLDQLKLYPEKVRTQFRHVIDWLHEWACTREEGLGTRLPWDEKWLIESLSDSTIYMAYYTIAHRITELDPEQLDDNFFDYVFLGKERELQVDKGFADELRAEFEYWYPVDFRNSGKDLIQNHLTFFLFNHTAIFPEEKWPRSIGTNGWVTVDGEKMSKSKGNVILVNSIFEQFGSDVPRITILSGGEELDDPNWETGFARSMVTKLANWYEFVTSRYGEGRDEYTPIDHWMRARLHETIRKATQAMDETLFRSGFQAIYFELTKHMRWYLRRCNNEPHREVWKEAVECQIRMMQPYAPHACEEAWEAIGGEGFVSLARWPEYDESAITEDTEWLITNTMEDIQTVSRLAGLEQVSTVRLFIAPDWKYQLFEVISEKLAEGLDQKAIISHVMSTELRQHGKEITKLIPKLLKGQKLPAYLAREQEKEILEQAQSFLENEYGANIELVAAEEATEQKAGQALPGKPAIVVE